MSKPQELPVDVNALKLRDIDLCVFADIANIHNVGLDLTLFVKGSVFSGQLISGREFYKLQSEKYSSFKADTIGSLVKQHFDARIQAYEKIYEVNEVENTDPDVSYLHLNKVSMQVGGTKVNIERGLLRLKIEEIDGYILGGIVTE